MVIFLNEENSELRGKMFPIPKGVMKHLKSVLEKYDNENGDKTNKGYDHLKWLVEQDRISTEELKRIKNFFDNYKGTDKSDDYKLNGGKPMSDWVNIILKHATQVSKDNKKAKKDAGLSNTDRKEHTKGERVHVGDIKANVKNNLSISLNESRFSVIVTEEQFKKYLENNKQKQQ